jgi:hypothetical protein
MEKLNLTKKYPTYYKAKSHPELVTIESAHYISIRGKGDPNGPDYAKRLGALYPVAYTIKFESKQQGKDFVVPKLEGLWWFDEQYSSVSISEAPVVVPRSAWEYRMLIRLPYFITKKMVDEGIQKAYAKKQDEMIKSVHYFEMSEGQCIQILHVGPYSTEPATLEKLHAFIVEKGLAKNGHHHEIYLNDPRKTAPEKLKTILREPVK